MLSPTAAGVRVPGSPEEVRSAGETNMSREENKSKFGGRLGYILNDSTALPRVTFSNGLIRGVACNWRLFWPRPACKCSLCGSAFDTEGGRAELDRRAPSSPRFIHYAGSLGGAGAAGRRGG